MTAHRTLHGAAYPPHPPSPRDPLSEARPPHRPPDQAAPGAHPARTVLVVLLVLLTLAGLAYGGGVAVDRVLEHRRIVALMGPKARLAPLPALEIPLAGARTLDMEVSLVLAPTVKAERVLRYQDRIIDRLFQTVSQSGAERLTEPGSALFLKETLKQAVRREAGPGLIQDIYIQRMVVR